MTIRAYAAPSAHAPLELYRYEPGALAAEDVEIQVEACALCHSDLHLIDNDWGISRYPLVPGHEVVGRIAQVGDNVTGLRVGDRVGVGWQRQACGLCKLCNAGHEHLCTDGKRRTCVDQPGGFAERVRTHQRFAFPIPAALTASQAAPLLCAGVTVFAPLLRHVRRPGQQVAVVGLGGLGHLAVQFARAMGSEVTAIDPVADKAAEAHRLGATAFLTTAQAEAEKGGRDFDLILTTTHAALDWNLWLAHTAINGTLCLVGVPSRPLTFAGDHVLDGQKIVTGSVIGSPEDMHRTLSFAAQHGIQAMVERLPFARINEAIDRVRRGEARYRIVLDNDFS